ncbi:glycosyltransferase family 2 protein [Adlercreutzia faecimuris]|uniref:Glycosyltransferase n=1 Tax=Adlercreutzia faecimuris TaxID=2897341 RepID=A0ABS9WIL8_9ACTN|nr:glycosyltransferase family 2 protein [Adlercreutzia sp. JBNU-10]MCI2242726.1 glycosyltransferase [Adlercreutzia sp. JBNU-10]
MCETNEEGEIVCEEPLLSVSIAACNSEAYLERCLDSCLGFEGLLDVIIVDDGSIDSTAEIADAYVETHPKIFRVIHKENGHYGSTVNASLPMARGKFYRLLDSDDWFNRESLCEWLKVLSESEADAVCTASLRIMEKSGCRITMDPWPNVESGEHDLENLDVNEVPGPGISNLAYRTDFLRKMKLSLLEHCNYVDEELRAVPWCRVRTVRVDHLPVYCVVKERDGQNTSLVGIRKSAFDKGKMLFHIIDQGDFGELGARTHAQTMALRVVADDVAGGCYSNMLLLDTTRETRKKIIDFDRRLKEELPEIYALSGRTSRTLRALRASSFLLYSPLAHRWQRKWRA